MDPQFTDVKDSGGDEDCSPPPLIHEEENNVDTFSHHKTNMTETPCALPRIRSQPVDVPIHFLPPLVPNAPPPSSNHSTITESNSSFPSSTVQGSISTKGPMKVCMCNDVGHSGCSCTYSDTSFPSKGPCDCKDVNVCPPLVDGVALPSERPDTQVIHTDCSSLFQSEHSPEISSAVCTCMGALPLKGSHDLHHLPIIMVNAIAVPSNEAQDLQFVLQRSIGNGSFGTVYQAKVFNARIPHALNPAWHMHVVAIKKVLQDRRYKNRELQIMKNIHHPNIVTLHYYFYSSYSKDPIQLGSIEHVEDDRMHKSHANGPDDVYLNLVLEYVPETVYRISRQYVKMKQNVPLVLVKLYMYQLFRALAYLHHLGVCHRDIKPQNLLVDPSNHLLKLCDFGSAKNLVPGEPNVSYICSRYYRAPELIFGATTYTTTIDIWSSGCVMAELLLGCPLFPGESGVDQLVEIIKILGTPTRDQIMAMNPNYTEFKFPAIKPSPWSKIFRVRLPIEVTDLLSRTLQYAPSLRITAMEALDHPMFEEIKEYAGKVTSQNILIPKELFDEQD